MPVLKCLKLTYIASAIELESLQDVDLVSKMFAVGSWKLWIYRSFVYFLLAVSLVTSDE